MERREKHDGARQDVAALPALLFSLSTPREVLLLLIFFLFFFFFLTKGRVCGWARSSAGSAGIGTDCPGVGPRGIERGGGVGGAEAEGLGRFRDGAGGTS